MVNKELVSYIQTNIKSFPFNDIKNYLLSRGYSDSDIEEAFNLAIGKKKLGIGKITIITSVSIVFIILLVLGYLFIMPNFTSKPQLEKLSLPIIYSDQGNVQMGLTNNSANAHNATNSRNLSLIQPEHLEYMLTEMSAYKLHNSPTGDTPKINFMIRDTGEEYSFSVEGNHLVLINATTNPDIQISADQEAISQIYNSDDMIAATKDYYNAGFIDVNVSASDASLLLKGYSSLASGFGITGGAVSGTGEEKFSYTWPIWLILLVLIIVVLVYLVSRKRALTRIKRKGSRIK